MKLIFTKEILEGLKIASSVTSGRNTLPILANVKITAEDDEITLSATDLEVGVELGVKGEIVAPGSITVPAKKLYAIVSALPDEVNQIPSIVKLTTEANDRTRVVCGSAKFNLAGLPDDEFPDMPEIGEGAYVVDASVFCKLLRKTASAASSEETRHFLCGVYLAAEGTHWEAVGTDGRRLAVAKHEAGNAISESINVIVPSKAVAAFIKTFSGELKVQVLSNQIVVSGNGLTMVSRLVEGEYPDYKAVMAPALSNDIAMSADRETLTNVLGRVSLLANQKTPQVKLVAKDGQIHLSANEPTVGEAEEFMPCSIEGEIEVAFNSAYVLDILSSIDTDEVVMAFKDSMSPVLIKEAEGDDYLCVLMPMRI